MVICRECACNSQEQVSDIALQPSPSIISQGVLIWKFLQYMVLIRFDGQVRTHNKSIFTSKISQLSFQIKKRSRRKLTVLITATSTFVAKPYATLLIQVKDQPYLVSKRILVWTNSKWNMPLVHGRNAAFVRKRLRRLAGLRWNFLAPLVTAHNCILGWGPHFTPWPWFERWKNARRHAKMVHYPMLFIQDVTEKEPLLTSITSLWLLWYVETDFPFPLNTRFDQI